MNKFGAKKTVVNGERFDSKKEAERYKELCLMERAGLITGLRRQVRYLLLPTRYDKNDRAILHSAVYIADFVYTMNDKTQALVVEDVKGYRKGPAYNLFMLKKKLMYDKYGILVKEV